MRKYHGLCIIKLSDVANKEKGAWKEMTEDDNEKIYKTETHLHVSEVSRCSLVQSYEVIRLYYEAGYKTVFVTDHFGEFTFERLGDIPWHEKIIIFLSGYYKAKEEGRKLGMNVLLAAEFNFPGTPNHYLAYGIDKEFLCLYPNLCEMDVKEFAEIARKHNILVIQAHPSRDGICYPTLEFVDGLETYNSNQRHEDENDRVETLARDHHLYMTCGSDTHKIEDVGGCAVVSEKEIKTVDDFIELIKSGQAKIYKGCDSDDLSS